MQVITAKPDQASKPQAGHNELTGGDAVRSLFATVDLQFAQRRLDQTLEMVPRQQAEALATRQRDAYVDMLDNPRAMANRQAALECLFSHPNLSRYDGRPVLSCTG